MMADEINSADEYCERALESEGLQRIYLDDRERFEAFFKTLSPEMKGKVVDQGTTKGVNVFHVYLPTEASNTW